LETQTPSEADDMPRFATAVILLLCAGSASAAAPTLTALSRRGGQRGSTTVIAVTGTNLTPTTRIVLPAAVAKQEVRTKPASTAVRVEIELTLAGDAEPGVHPLRVATDDGISGALLFEVGTMAEVDEVEPNNAFDKPTEIKDLPITINGAVAGSDIDLFRVRLKKGQRLAIEATAQRLGSSVLPVVGVHSVGGRLLAAGEPAAIIGSDVRTTLIAPDDGDYFVQINDLLFRGAGAAQYRLKLGDFDYADAVFPLGARRGATTELTFVGGNLTKPVTGKVEPKTGSEGRLVVRLPASAGSHVIALSDLPEVLEAPQADGKPQAITAPAAVNGILAKPVERDRFAIKLAPGKWRFQVDAHALGSPTTPTLELTDMAGKRLAVGADVPGSFDQFVVFAADAKTPEVVAVVGDLVRKGGPAYGYRLCVERADAPDFELRFEDDTANVPADGVHVLRVHADRAGYDGPIALRVAGVPAGVTVEGAELAAGTDDALMCLIGPKGALAPASLTITGEADAGGVKLVRIARRVEMIAPEGGPTVSPAIGSQVTVAGTTAPAQLVASAASTKLFPGMPFTLKVKAQRGAEATGAINLSAVTNLLSFDKASRKTAQQFVTAGDAKAAIKAGTDEANFELKVDPKSPLRTVRLAVQGAVLDKAGKPAGTIVSRALTLQIVAPFAVEMADKKPTMAAGAKLMLKGKIVREAGFDKAVEVRPGKLPTGFVAKPAIVAAGAVDFEIEITCPANTKPGEFAVPLGGVWVIDPKTNYSLPELPVTVSVTGK